MLLWGPELRVTRAGVSSAALGLWPCTVPALIGFMLRQFEIARLVGIRPQRHRLLRPDPVFVSVFLMYRPEQFPRPPRCGRDLPLPPSSRASAAGPESFHMMGVAILGGALLCAIHGATVENTLPTASRPTPSRRSSPPGKKRPIPWSRQLLEPNSVASQALAALLHAVRACDGPVTSSIGIIGLALNLRAYDQKEIRAAEDPEFETFYTKNVLLNEGLRAWMAPADQPHENFVFPEEVLPRGNASLIVRRQFLSSLGMLWHPFFVARSGALPRFCCISVTR